MNEPDRNRFSTGSDLIELIYRGIVPFMLGFYILSISSYILTLMNSDSLGFYLASLLTACYMLSMGVTRMCSSLIDALYTISQIPQVRLWLYVQKEKIKKGKKVEEVKG